jgi:DNA-directed RNA polymerase subunit RPC12/RpoP
MLSAETRIHTVMKHIKLFEDFGAIEVDPYEVPTQIECNKCGWNWNSTQSSKEDLYLCHKCGADNKVYYEGEPDDEEESGEVATELGVIQ